MYTAWRGRRYDADLSKYLYTIPHDKLEVALKERITDPRIIHLIKLWLKVPIVEEDGRYTGGKSNKKGTPQGGVISPLLATGHRYTFPLGYVDQSNLVEEYFIFNAKNKVNLPAYHRMDFGFMWDKELGRDHIFGVRFGVYNIYGRRNIVSTFPDLEIENDQVDFQVRGVVILRWLPYLNLKIKKRL